MYQIHSVCKSRTLLDTEDSVMNDAEKSCRLYRHSILQYYYPYKNSYLFIVNIYILLPRCWGDIFCKNVISSHINLPLLCCVCENLDN